MFWCNRPFFKCYPPHEIAFYHGTLVVILSSKRDREVRKFEACFHMPLLLSSAFLFVLLLPHTYSFSGSHFLISEDVKICAARDRKMKSIDNWCKTVCPTLPSCSECICWHPTLPTPHPSYFSTSYPTVRPTSNPTTHYPTMYPTKLSTAPTKSPTSGLALRQCLGIMAKKCVASAVSGRAIPSM
jgi:hypothetical protein